MIRANPGKLRHTVSLQSPASAAGDSWGPADATWTTYATVAAELKPYSAKEQDKGSAVESETRWFVRIRYRSGVYPTHRVVLASGKVLEIVGVIDTENRHEELRLDCVESPAT